jgi:PTS system nitrogen regulatory IIA component
MSDLSAPLPTAPNRFEPLLTPADAGRYLGVHQKTAIKMAREGSIPALRVGENHWRFRRTDLELWVEQQVKSAPPA